MKKILLLILIFSYSSVFASELTPKFSKEAFNEAQDQGKTVVIYSWNKFCGTCKKQKPILKLAKEDFENVLFLFIEHTKNKNLVKELNINHWSTIVVYKNNKKITSSVGLVDKDQIYSLIKKGI